MLRTVVNNTLLAPQKRKVVWTKSASETSIALKNSSQQHSESLATSQQLTQNDTETKSSTFFSLLMDAHRAVVSDAQRTLPFTKTSHLPMVKIASTTKTAKVQSQQLVEESKTHELAYDYRIPPPPPPLQPLPHAKKQPTIKIKQLPVVKVKEADDVLPLPALPPKQCAAIMKEISQAVDDLDISQPFIPPPPPSQPQNKKKSATTQNSDMDAAYPKFPSLLTPVISLQRFVVIDFEATGIGGGWDEITEIGAVEYLGGRITGNKFHTLTYPGYKQDGAEYKIHHKVSELTGITIEMLRDSPRIQDVMPDFARFIEGAWLVFHNTYNDLRWFNNALKRSGCSDYTPIEQKYQILDTSDWAMKVNTGAAKSLHKLCQHFNIDTLTRHAHNALEDAELTARLFDQFLRQYGCDYIVNQMQSACKLDFYNRFQDILGTEGEQYFRQIGIKSILPKAFRFIPKIHHPQLNTTYPAIAVAFTKDAGEVSGLYLRYLMSGYDSSQYPACGSEILKNKFFYGSAKNATVDIHKGGLGTIFIGSILNALIAMEMLLGSTTKKINADNFSIKAYLDIQHIPSLTFDPSTKEVVLLIDNAGKNHATLKQDLVKYVECFFNPYYVGLLDKVEKEQNIEGCAVKYAGSDWVVASDHRVKHMIYIQCKKEAAPHLTIIINTKSKTITVRDEELKNPDKAVLVASPKVTLKVVMLTTEVDDNTSVVDMLRTCPAELESRILNPFHVKSLKDLSCVELACKIELARRMYALSSNTPTAAAENYLKQREIIGTWPESFHHSQDVYHPWSKRKLPATFAPLWKFNAVGEEIITGVHRIFYNEDGSPLEPEYKKYKKVSLGDAVGIWIEIGRGAISQNRVKASKEEAEVAFILEGPEDAVLLWHAIQNLDPVLLHKLQTTLNITGVFAIKSCVGVNGLEGIPMDRKTNTVVLVADNDVGNKDVWDTIQKTVASYLRAELVVKIAMPKTHNNQKLDINDAWKQTKSDERLGLIADILCNAVHIRDSKDLLLENESMQESLHRLRLSGTPHDTQKYDECSMIGCNEDGSE
jgi:DNA polymerase-3 subunit epsilon